MYFREEVKAFALAMEEKLRVNDHKGGWRYCSRKALFDRLREEIEELKEVCINWPTAYEPKHVASEAADIGNFAMMLADVCGGLEPYKRKRAEGMETEDRVAELEARVKELEAACAAYRRVLEMCDYKGERLGIKAPEDKHVKALCEQFGYGAVMDSVARQWRESLGEHGSGAFVVGPCSGTIADLLNSTDTGAKLLARLEAAVRVAEAATELADWMGTVMPGSVLAKRLRNALASWEEANQ